MTRRYVLARRASCSPALVAIAGCKDNDDPSRAERRRSTGLPFPDTPDQLMANFQTALTSMDLAAYRDEVLADRVRASCCRAATVEEFGLPDGVFDRVEELAIVAEDVHRPAQRGRPGARRPSRSSPCSRKAPGCRCPAPDLYFGDIPGALVRNYNLLIYFNLQGEFRYEVRGDAALLRRPRHRRCTRAP